MFFKTILNEHELVQVVLNPTHKSGYTLDLVIIPKSFPLLDNINVNVVDKVISDHFTLYMDLFIFSLVLSL